MKILAALMALGLPLMGYSQVSGRVYPERNDDLSWENDLVAFRVYGPETQRRGEKSFGYDIFLKYPGKGEVLERLYGEQCSAANWAKVDSLRKVDPKQAKAFQDSFSYHIDHGYGMDCYAVGSTLGCGLAAIAIGDSICYPWCYDKVEILENGPERFQAKLIFAPVRIGDDAEVVESRVITLDKGTHLNHCEVSYSGLTADHDVVVGFPMRGTPKEYADVAKGILAATDPTQGSGNGTIFLGLRCSNPCSALDVADGHVLLRVALKPGETLAYEWGYAWDRTDIDTFEKWIEYLNK